MVLGQATSFVAVYLYTIKEAHTFTPRSLLNLMVALEISFCIFFAVFVKAITREYRMTFFSTMTGKQFTSALFRNASDDQTRFSIFLFHPTFYSPIRNEVEAWVIEKYGSWEEEPPAWLTERMMASVPKELAERGKTNVLEEKRQKEEHKKRRGSLEFMRLTVRQTTTGVKGASNEKRRVSLELLTRQKKESGVQWK